MGGSPIFSGALPSCGGYAICFSLSPSYISRINAGFKGFFRQTAFFFTAFGKNSALFSTGNTTPAANRNRKLAEELGLKERIFLPGSVADVASAIYRASFFVLSSYSEGMPNTLIEAMALGIPSISTDCPCGGPAELIEDGVNGYLIEPGNWKKLQDILQKLMDNPDLAKKVGGNAAKIQEKLNPDRINKMWEDYFYNWMGR